MMQLQYSCWLSGRASDIRGLLHVRVNYVWRLGHNDYSNKVKNKFFQVPVSVPYCREREDMRRHVTVEHDRRTVGNLSGDIIVHLCINSKYYSELHSSVVIDPVHYSMYVHTNNDCMNARRS